MAHSELDRAYMIKLCAHAARQESVEVANWLESGEVEEAMALLPDIENSALNLLGHLKALRASLAAKLEGKGV